MNPGPEKLKPLTGFQKSLLTCAALESLTVAGTLLAKSIEQRNALNLGRPEKTLVNLPLKYQE